MTDRHQILTAIEGHGKGVPLLMCIVAAFGGGLVGIIVLPDASTVLFAILWASGVLMRMLFVFPTGKWVAFTPNDFKARSWLSFYSGFFGLKRFD